MSARRCGGIITEETTDEDLRARGFSEADIAEVRAFQERLRRSTRSNPTPTTPTEADECSP